MDDGVPPWVPLKRQNGTAPASRTSGGEFVPAAGVRTCTTPPCERQYFAHAAGVAPWAVVAVAAAAASAAVARTAAALVVVLTSHPRVEIRGDSLTTRRCGPRPRQAPAPPRARSGASRARGSRRR